MNFNAVIFDADETIFNNQGIHEIVTEQILHDLGLSLALTNEVHKRWDIHYFAEQNKSMNEVGYCIDRENNAKSLVKALRDFNINLSYEKASKYWQVMINEYSINSKPYPDALNLIDYLNKKKIKMAIVSNGDQEIIELRLKNAKIEGHFEFIIAPCEELPLTKPDIKIFNESLMKLQTTADKVVFIGDNPHSDIMGANKAGMYSVLIDRYSHFNELNGEQIPKLKIKSFEEILFLFE
ncbi:MAG: HAD family hydrolase [Asgard group archaeon]|nr:HAD family hydrolase [Asgard group archaeon]